MYWSFVEIDLFGSYKNSSSDSSGTKSPSDSNTYLVYSSLVLPNLQCRSQFLIGDPFMKRL